MQYTHIYIHKYMFFLVCPNNSGGSPATNGNLDGNWYFLMWKPKNIGLGDFETAFNVETLFDVQFTRWTDPYPSWLVGMKQECTYLWKFLQFSCHHIPSSWWNMAYGRKMMEYDGTWWNIMEYTGIFVSIPFQVSIRGRLMDVAPRDLSQIANAMATIGQTEVGKCGAFRNHWGVRPVIIQVVKDRDLV